MSVQDTYKDMVKEIGLVLTEEEFLRKGNCFYRRLSNNWGLIDFQKSRKSTKDEIIFTINIGISSGILMNFFSPDLASKKPSIDACQWRQRIGFLLPNRDDKWWMLTESSKNLVLDEIMRHLINLGIPTVNSHLSDAQLCKEWLSGISPGITDIQRLLNLAVLAKKTEEDVNLNKIISELKQKSHGKSSEFMVNQHLKTLLDKTK